MSERETIAAMRKEGTVEDNEESQAKEKAEEEEGEGQEDVEEVLDEQLTEMYEVRPLQAWREDCIQTPSTAHKSSQSLAALKSCAFGLAGDGPPALTRACHMVQQLMGLLRISTDWWCRTSGGEDPQHLHP